MEKQNFPMLAVCFLLAVFSSCVPDIVQADDQFGGFPSTPYGGGGAPLYGGSNPAAAYGGRGLGLNGYGLGSSTSYLSGGFYPRTSYTPAGAIGNNAYLQQLMSGFVASGGYGGAYNNGAFSGGAFIGAGYGYNGESANGASGYGYNSGFSAAGVPVIPQLRVSLTGPGGFPIKGAQVGAVAQYGYPGSLYSAAMYSQQTMPDGYPTVLQATGGQYAYPGGYPGAQAQQQYTLGIGAGVTKQALAFAPYGG